MNHARPDNVPPSYRAFRLLLTTLLAGTLTALLLAGSRHQVPARLLGWAADMWRGVRDGLVPW